MKHITKNEDIDEVDFENSIDDNDYVLILNNKGELKTVIMPDDDNEDLPDNVTNILNMFGIHGLGSQYLH